MCHRADEFHNILCYLFFTISFHSCMCSFMIDVEAEISHKTKPNQTKPNNQKKKNQQTFLSWRKFVQSFIYSIKGLYGCPVKWNHLIRRWYNYSTEVLQLNSVIATWSINCVFLYAVCSYKIALVWSIVPSILFFIFNRTSRETVQLSQTPE